MYILTHSAVVMSRFCGYKSMEGEAGVIRVILNTHTSIDVIKRSMRQPVSGTSEGKQDVRVSRAAMMLWNRAMMCEMPFRRAFKNTCTPP